MAPAEEFSTTATTGITTGYSNNYSDPYDDYYGDYNHSDYGNEICNRTGSQQFAAIFNPIFFSIVMIFSLVGNILVFVILVKYENVKTLTNALILNLAVSDLLFTLGLPFWASYHVYGWTLGEPACKIVSFVFSIGFYSSGIILTLMTAHRYVAVTNPLSGLLSARGVYSVTASLVIWAASVLVATPALIFTKVLSENYCELSGSVWSLWGTYQQNVLFILSSVVFIFCYSHITCRLLRPSAPNRNNKTLKLIFFLMLVFFVGWAPYNTVIFLKSMYFWPKSILAGSCETFKALDYAFFISRLFAFSHCCLNPVFYVFVGVKYKKHVKKLLTFQRDSSTRSRQNRLTITSLTSGEEFVL